MNDQYLMRSDLYMQLMQFVRSIMRWQNFERSMESSISKRIFSLNQSSNMHYQVE